MNYLLTLARWHKVAERINAALKEREANVKAAFTATSISAWNREGIEEKAADIVHRAAADLELVEAGLKAVAAIRTAVALKNAQLGIAGKRAEAEAAKRRAALYKAVLDGQKADMVRPESVRSLPAELIITLQTADAFYIEVLRAKLLREQTRAARLLDEIADLNHDRLEIELPREVLGLAGLTA